MIDVNCLNPPVTSQLLNVLPPHTIPEKQSSKPVSQTVRPEASLKAGRGDELARALFMDPLLVKAERASSVLPRGLRNGLGTQSSSELLRA